MDIIPNQSSSLMDVVSGGNQLITTFPASQQPTVDIYLLPDFPHIPQPVIAPPVFEGDPDL